MSPLAKSLENATQLSRKALILCLVLAAASASILMFRGPASNFWQALAPIVVIVSTLTAVILTSRITRLVRQSWTEQIDMERRQISNLKRDETTGALSRRAFIEAAEALLKSMPSGNGYALFLIDMDHLKQINDGYGHETGDAALKHLALVASRAARGGLLGRLGGDEFAILVICPSPDRATEIAFGVLSELNRTVYCARRPLNLSASIGIALAPADGEFFDDLLNCADLALYESKRNGRAQATLFERDMLRDHKHVRLIERELRAAILLDELELAYQPLTDRDDRIVGCEALVRWRHPVRGLVPPNDFIPIAEQSLLIDLLGEWVLKRACRDISALNDLPVSVNFSASQFKRDDVVALVERVLSETGLPPARLIVEITESVAVNPHSNVLKRLKAIKEMGVRIALDDFGAGFSGFGYLRTFPVHSIKIDRSFVAKLGESDADNVLVTALSSVAAAMRLSVVAEGIETSSQQLLAKAAGCTHFQGYHISRPQPFRALIDMIETSNAPAEIMRRQRQG